MIEPCADLSGRVNRAALIVLILLGLAGAITGVLAFMAPSAPPPAQQTPALAPFAPAQPDTYTGPAATPSLAPNMLSIPGVGLAVGLVDAGHDDSGYLMVPGAAEAARYAGSAAVCAAQGSTLVAGHVNFPDGSPAPMASLLRVAKGMPLYASDTSGMTCRYKIVGLESLPKTSLPADTFAAEGPHVLRVVTCDLASPFVAIAGQAQFANNTVATAIPWP